MLKRLKNALKTVVVTKVVNASVTLASNKLVLAFVVDVTKVSIGTVVHVFMPAESTKYSIMDLTNVNVKMDTDISMVFVLSVPASTSYMKAFVLHAH